MESKYKIKNFKFGKLITSDFRLFSAGFLLDAVLLENLKGNVIKKGIIVREGNKKSYKHIEHWHTVYISNLREATDSELVLAIAKLKDEKLREKLKVFFKNR